MSSWDDLKLAVQDNQPGAEHLSYRRGCWWVEECLIRDEDGRVIGRMMARTLISDAQVARVWDEHRVKLVDEDLIVGPTWFFGESK